MTQPLMDRIRERKGSKVGPLSPLPERRSTCRDCGQRPHRMTYVQGRPPARPSLLKRLAWWIAAALILWLFILGALVPWMTSVLSRAMELLP